MQLLQSIFFRQGKLGVFQFCPLRVKLIGEINYWAALMRKIGSLSVQPERCIPKSGENCIYSWMQNKNIRLGNRILLCDDLGDQEDGSRWCNTKLKRLDKTNNEGSWELLKSLKQESHLITFTLSVYTVAENWKIGVRLARLGLR